MEQIAEKAGTTKRMVVYHFKNKENLYLLVLEHVYTQIRASEKALSLAGMPPSKRWSTWLKPPLTIMPTTRTTSGLSAWKTCSAAALCSSRAISARSTAARSTCWRRSCAGERKQLFSQTVDARDLHRLISSFSFHYVANSYTFTLLFEEAQTSRRSASTTVKWPFRWRSVTPAHKIACN
jgi:AcrR family transcriptional regulator